MEDPQLLRYSRHILLNEIGIEGQVRILSAHALIIGAGGLGSPVALYLGSAGVGQITVIDDDVVDVTNLQRQIAHSMARVGDAKTSSAQSAIAAINPEVNVTAIQARAKGDLLDALVAQTTTPPATPSTQLVCGTKNRWFRAPLSGLTAKSACLTRASRIRPATPACFRPTTALKKPAARRWAFWPRWWASLAQCRRPRR